MIKEKILLFDETGAGQDGVEIQLPFVPMPGIWIQVPWLDHEPRRIDGVYWNAVHDRGPHFAVFMENGDSDFLPEIYPEATPLRPLCELSG